MTKPETATAEASIGAPAARATPLSTRDMLVAWIDEHSDYLLHYCRKYVRSYDVAEDLVQETFLAAVKAIDSFQSRSAPRTWLVGILRHKIFDRLRVMGREEPVEADALERRHLEHLFDSDDHWHAETGPLHWSSSPEKVVSNRQFLGVLESCLEKLPEKFRSAFLLREMEELSREEIAKQLNLTANHVGVLLFRARAELQECLQTNWLKKARTA